MRILCRVVRQNLVNVALTRRIAIPLTGILLLLLLFSSLGKVTWASSIRIQLGSDAVEAPMELTIETQIDDANPCLWVIICQLTGEVGEGGSEKTTGEQEGDG